MSKNVNVNVNVTNQRELSSEEVRGWTAMIKLACIGFFLYKCYEFASKWERLEAPYKQVGWFYDHTVILYFQCFEPISNFIVIPLKWIPYPNLAGVLTLLVLGAWAIIYGGFTFVMLTCIAVTFKHVKEIRLCVYLFLSPAIFAVLYTIGCWLFAT